MSPVRGGGTVSSAVIVNADGSFGPVRHAADLTCPKCGHAFRGHWVEGRNTAPQTCPVCGNVFAARWPGFCLPPEIMPAASAGGDRGDDA